MLTLDFTLPFHFQASHLAVSEEQNRRWRNIG